MNPESSVMFVSKAGVSHSGSVHSYKLKKQIEVVKNCRAVTKKDLKFNNATPKVEVDPKTFVRCFLSHIFGGSGGILGDVLISSQAVTADGVELKSEAAESLPLTTQFFIY